MHYRSESEERRAAEEEAHEDSRRRGQQATLAEVSALTGEAQELPVDPALMGRLEGLVASGEDWEARASGVLNPKKVLHNILLKSSHLPELNSIDQWWRCLHARDREGTRGVMDSPRTDHVQNGY